MFVLILNPKSRRCRTSEHVLLDDPLVIGFFEWFCRGLMLDVPVWPWSVYFFQKDWDFVFGHVLLLPLHGDAGFTFGTLRAGSATEIYRRTRRIDLVRWHLRHRSAQTTLENYVQELPQALARARLSLATRSVVMSLAPLARSALEAAVCGTFGSGLRALHSPPPAALPGPAGPSVPKCPKKKKRKVKRNLLRELHPCLDDGGYWKIAIPAED
jgi:hypothetical protein